LAKSLGCEYVEIPADFVKNKTEMEKTYLKLGDFLSEEAITRLYEKSHNVPRELKYILHTEPSLIRRDGYGMSYQAPLRWYDKEWREEFISMVISISKFFSLPATVVEIHPGDRRNSSEDIGLSISLLLDKYKEEFKVEPLVLLENRTGQFISDGKEIDGFWKILCEKYGHLRSKAGIVLDIQQLYTVTKKRFVTELEIIPLEAIKGFHIHYKHGVPDLSNEIPWKHVFDRMPTLEKEVLINPEVLRKNNVEDAIRFCKEMLLR